MLVRSLREIGRAFDTEKFDKLLSNPEFLELLHLYGDYSEDSSGPIKVFWNTYLEMVATLMNFISATREGHWKLYIDSVKKMSPWFFAYNHTNYARYLMVYSVTMVSLQDTRPEAHQLLADGNCGVERSKSHGCCQLAVD